MRVIIPAVARHDWSKRCGRSGPRFLRNLGVRRPLAVSPFACYPSLVVQLFDLLWQGCPGNVLCRQEQEPNKAANVPSSRLRSFSALEALICRILRAEQSRHFGQSVPRTGLKAETGGLAESGRTASATV